MPAVERLVLPSPNGSTIAETLSHHDTEILAGGFRNAEAIARALRSELLAGASVGIIAAGERWASNGSLRPSLEDHLGAGAIAFALGALGTDAVMSPEALAAAALFGASRAQLRAMVHGSVGGRELASWGFTADVVLATEVNASTTVPVLIDGAFQSRRPAQ